MGKRLSSIDNAKGVLIYLVILGHVAERFVPKSFLAGRVQLWIYFFHMPAFVFLAGLFSKKIVREKRVDKAFGYLLLYCFMKVVFYLSNVYVKGADKAEFHFFTENGIPWFCMAMFWWYLITILLERFPPAAVLSVSLILGILSGYFPVEGGFLVILRTICFYPFFYAGFITDPEALLRLTRNRKGRVAGILVLVAAMLFSFLAVNRSKQWMMLFRGRYHYAEIGAEFCGITGAVCRVAAYVFSTILSLALISVVPDRNTWLTKVGRRTLPVYVFHGTFYTCLIGKVDFIKEWIRSGHIFLHCVVFSIFILLLTMLPPFEWIVHRIMEIPGKAAEICKNS